MIINNYFRCFFDFMKIKFKILKNYATFLVFLLIIVTNLHVFLKIYHYLKNIKSFLVTHYPLKVYHFHTTILYSTIIITLFR